MPAEQPKSLIELLSEKQFSEIRKKIEANPALVNVSDVNFTLVTKAEEVYLELNEDVLDAVDGALESLNELKSLFKLIVTQKELTLTSEDIKAIIYIGDTDLFKQLLANKISDPDFNTNATKLLEDGISYFTDLAKDPKHLTSQKLLPAFQSMKQTLKMSSFEANERKLEQLKAGHETTQKNIIRNATENNINFLPRVTPPKEEDKGLISKIRSFWK